MRATRVDLCAAAAFVALALAQAGCSLGQGEGRVHSDRLVAKDCWGLDSAETCAANGGAGCAYDLQPDFFAAVPYRETLQIRVQRGNDLTEVSDGLSVLVDDLEKIRNEFLGTPLCVALPPGVAPPGSPEGAVPVMDAGVDGGADAGVDGGADAGTTGVADCLGPLVHMSLYLQQSCHNQNIVLYAVKGTATFTELFSGDPNEKDAAEKYTAATFDVMVGDPRDVPLGARADQIPEDKQSRLDGSFRFYFERGQPGQPFP
jgi:hypothetical protein